MRNCILAVFFATAVSATAPAQEYTYTISGVFTDTLLGTPSPSISNGTPFSASFSYRLPGTPVLLDGGIGWYSFTAEMAYGSVVLGPENYSIAGGNFIIWHENPSYSTVEPEGFGGGLTFRAVLSTTDRASLDTMRIPDTLSLSQFDYRREFQVFDGSGISIIGRIDSLTVVPEPSVISLGGSAIALFLFFHAFHRRRPNKSLQPTPGSALSSAARFTSLSPAWLSLIVSRHPARVS